MKMVTCIDLLFFYKDLGREVCVWGGGKFTQGKIGLCPASSLNKAIIIIYHTTSCLRV